MNNQQTMLFQGMQIPPPRVERGSACHARFHRAGSPAHREWKGDMRPPSFRRRAHLLTGHVYRNGARDGVKDRGGSWWH